MSSPGQKRGACGHAMTSFDGHLSCARCRDKGKGKDTCLEGKDSANCSHCNALTLEQKAQLATPSYKLKKEKREAKKLETDSSKDTQSLVDPSSVSVLGVVDNSGTVKSPSLPPEKKVKQDKTITKPKKASSSMDSKITNLEALRLSKSFQPSFSSEVRVTPTHSPPAHVSKDSEPFFQPTLSSAGSSNVEHTGPDYKDAAKLQSAGKLQPTQHEDTSTQHTGPDFQFAAKQRSAGKLPDRPSKEKHSSKRTGPDNKDATRHQSAGKLPPNASGCTGPDKFALGQQLTGKPGIDRPLTDLQTGLQTDFSPHPHRTYAGHLDRTAFQVQNQLQTVNYLTGHWWNCLLREGELSGNQDMDLDHTVSEEQTYRETMRGIRSYMGWSHVPDIDSSNPSDDNPFAGPKAPAPSKVSVQMPTEDWLCRKLAQLNVALVEGYPSQTSEAGGLLLDQFLRPAKSQARWYGICPGQKCDPPGRL